MADDNKRTKLIERVRKLLALAAGGAKTKDERYKTEATAARRQANALMKRHKITRAELALDDDVFVGVAGVGSLEASWKKRLLAAVALRHECRVRMVRGGVALGGARAPRAVRQFVYLVNEIDRVCLATWRELGRGVSELADPWSGNLGGALETLMLGGRRARAHERAALVRRSSSRANGSAAAACFSVFQRFAVSAIAPRLLADAPPPPPEPEDDEGEAVEISVDESPEDRSRAKQEMAAIVRAAESSESIFGAAELGELLSEAVRRAQRFGREVALGDALLLEGRVSSTARAPLRRQLPTGPGSGRSRAP